MKNLLKYILLCFCIFLPIGVKAATYQVEVVRSDAGNTSLGTFSDYNEAKRVMNEYPSDNKNVAAIYRDGKIINAKYAVSQFNYNHAAPDSGGADNIHRLFPSTTSSTVYTTVAAPYGIDAAFLDYDVSSDRAQIKISGYTGWTYLANINVVPISKLATSVKITATTNITVRADHNTGSTALGSVALGDIYTFYDKYYDGTYTWYKIYYNGGYGWFASLNERWSVELDSGIQTYYEHHSKGNLIHYYNNHWGTSYTNLGPAPSYLNGNMNYYSFDGQYFYDDYKKMIDDYKENSNRRAVNAGKPHYAYYLYLPNHSKTGYTADDFNQIIRNYGYTSKAQSAMYDEGQSFIESQEKYGVNALLTFSAAINESAKGTSDIARYKNNLFGHGAYDNCPFDCATSYASVKEGIMAHAKMTGAGYNSPSDWRYYGSHYGNKQSGMNIQYATDPYWGEKAAHNAFINDHNFGSQDYLINTIGLKISDKQVEVKKQPNEQSETIYVMKNKSTSVANMPVIVLDKVTQNNQSWYKVYTDASLDGNQNVINDGTYSFENSYGYIKVEDLYVTNNQPTIYANDIQINVGDLIDLKKNVTANDVENGDLTSRITVTSDVNPMVEGNYTATYTVEDDSRFSVSKTVSVKVVGHSVPTITAKDQEVIQYRDFDPYKGVTANDAKDGNLTKQIQIEKNEVNTKEPGVYTVIYSVTNSYQEKVTKEIKVTVLLNEKPVISAQDKVIALNHKFEPLEGVTAEDKEDGPVEVILIENKVQTDQEGTYPVTYKAVDQDKQETRKTIQVTVKKQVQSQKEGRFYLSYLQEKNGKLEIKGYQTIDGIDNTLGEDISYELVLKNERNQKEYTISLDRLTKKEEMDMPILSSDGKDYTYAWFKDTISFDQIPQGDYKAYLRANTDAYYSESIVQNILFNEQVVQYNTDKKYVTITNDYLSDDIPMIFTIRDEKIADKQTDASNTPYTYLNKVALEDGKLEINFASYAVGVDMQKDTKVQRKVILENMDTLEKIVYTPEVTTNGPFVPQLLQKDKFGLTKEKAWSTVSLDLTNMDEGDYRIYVVNESNISDYGEMNDLLFTDLSKGNGVVNQKQVSLSVNEEIRNRVELHIKKNA